ncbi:S1 family peptidase [Cellulomonas sp. ACRRI]|uniref:S1 family peptidase n=1 Tax=Cellulomonas sp. ACRRI TaxID=2918188 RepID=UPI001EF1DE6A|nr:S1 family peptidase [Cellulomonas sp. ACRRI]MCG7287267.1 S1 family peptidase [Cellulomonas sp. ACRRI]
MSARWKGRVTFLAVGTLAAASLTGAVGTAAFAEDGDAVTPTSGAEFDANARALLALDGVEAVTVDADGNVVVATTEDVGDLPAEAEQFVDEHRNVDVLVLDGPVEALAATDVVGGAGYAALDPQDLDGDAMLCSIGFSGYSPSGAPAVISAGHCAGDGLFSESILTVPAGDDAGGGSTVAGLAPLGTLGFAQYGGPGSTDGTDGDTASTDVSVIDVTNAGLTLRPAVTDWTTVSDLSRSTRPVTAVGRAQLGQPVVKSGRTTGFTSGTALSSGWAEVSGRYVYGFFSAVASDSGDSGGAVLQDGTAIGLVSGGTTAGGQPVMFAADLETALARTGGYTVALDLAAPVLTGPASGTTIVPGAMISGTAPAGTVLSVDSDREAPQTVTVAADGTWSFAAPTTRGPVSYTLVARSGYSASPAVQIAYDVVPATVVTRPGDGERVLTALQRIAGVGVPGETVELSGAVAATLVVADDGTWEHPVDLSYGRYSVTVAQVSGEPSVPMTNTFEVVPVAPAITGLDDGATFPEGAAPTTVSGTGLDGATVEVTVGDRAAVRADVTAGGWALALGDALGAGHHVIAATQTINGAASDATAVGITVTATAAPAVTATDDPLARTGAGTAGLIAAIAAVLLLAGAAATYAARRSAA